MRNPVPVTDAIRARNTARAVAAMPRPGAYRAFVPKLDDKLVVSFPGEQIRVPVKKVVTDDIVFVLVDVVPMSKSHRFEFDKTYPVRRRIRDGRDVWEAQYENDFMAEQRRNEPAPIVTKAAIKKAPVKKVSRK
jgi:hypothetical protein